MSDTTVSAPVPGLYLKEWLADWKKLTEAYRKAGGRGAWMANNGYDKALAEQAVESGRADLFAFGRPFISNSDLVERLRTGASLAPADSSTFYGGGAKD